MITPPYTYWRFPSQIIHPHILKLPIPDHSFLYILKLPIPDHFSIYILKLSIPDHFSIYILKLPIPDHSPTFWSCPSLIIHPYFEVAHLWSFLHTFRSCPSLIISPHILKLPIPDFTFTHSLRVYRPLMWDVIMTVTVKVVIYYVAKFVYATTVLVTRLATESLLSECDILCLQESWLAKQDLGDLSLQNDFHGISTIHLYDRLDGECIP